MKAACQYICLFYFLLHAGIGKAKELILSNHTVEENLPAGSVVGDFKIPEGTQKVWLSGIQDVALHGDTCLIVREGGELWSLYTQAYSSLPKDQAVTPERKREAMQSSLAKVFDSGIESVASNSNLHAFVKANGSAWVFRHIFYRMRKSGKALPLKEKPIQLFTSGIRKVALNDRWILALGRTVHFGRGRSSKEGKHPFQNLCR